MVKIYNGVIVYQNISSIVIPDGVVDDLTVNNIATINTLHVTNTLGLTDVNLTKGTITSEPENENDITNKAYVDSAVTASVFDPTQPLTLSGNPNSLTVKNESLFEKAPIFDSGFNVKNGTSYMKEININDEIIIAAGKINTKSLTSETITAGTGENQIILDSNGNITAKTLTSNDISAINETLSGTLTVSGSTTLSSGSITSTPTGDNDIVNKSYVDSAISGGSFDPSKTLNLTNTSLSLKTLGAADIKLINVMDTSNPYSHYHVKIEKARIGFVDTKGNYIGQLNAIHNTINDTYNIGLDYTTSNLTITNNLTPKITINNNNILMGNGANQITLDTNAGKIDTKYINIKNNGTVDTKLYEYQDGSDHDNYITNKKYVDTAFNRYKILYGDNHKLEETGNITIPAGADRLSWTPKPFIFRTNILTEYFSYFVLNHFKTYNNFYENIIDIDMKTVLENQTPSIIFNYPIAADIIYLNGYDFLIFTSDWCRTYYNSELYIYNLTARSFVQCVKFPNPGKRYIKQIKVYNNMLFISENTTLDEIKYNYYIRLTDSNISSFKFENFQQLSINESIGAYFNEMFIEGDFNGIYIYTVFKDKVLLYNLFTYKTTKTLTQNSETIDDAIKINNVIYCRCGNKIYYNNILNDELGTLLLTLNDTSDNNSIVLQNISNNLYITYNNYGYVGLSQKNQIKLIIINDKEIINNSSPFDISSVSTLQMYLYNLNENIYSNFYIEYNNTTTKYYLTFYNGCINYLSKNGGLSTLKGSIKNDSICINSTGKYDNGVVNIEYIKQLFSRFCNLNSLTSPFNY